ncbi:lactonase family protein [Tropicimonas sp.]|uniref:lactonase family protein n=1 Tax=Tropicimonas sp. TaxID=2067044 RepID=UPI003A857FB1
MRYRRSLAGSLAAMALLAGAAPTVAGTFVYVSNAKDGNVAGFALSDDGRLAPLGLSEAAPLVMPMTSATDGSALYAAVRSEPFAVHAWRIDAESGALTPLGTAPLAANMLYLSLDQSGRYLFAASNSSDLITVNALDEAGRVSDTPVQSVQTRDYVHAVRTDATNRYLFAPSLGENVVEQFTFDPATATLAYNAAQTVPLPEESGPRHFIVSPDNRHLYVVSQFLGVVSAFALDGATGQLTALGDFDGMPGTRLHPGKKRPPVSSAGPAKPDPEAIWAADIGITPDGRWLYISERTESRLIGFARDPESGALSYLGATDTEQQPRDFAISPDGAFLIAAGEKSGHIAAYRIDPESGTLTLRDRQETGAGPAWVEIVRTD